MALEAEVRSTRDEHMIRISRVEEYDIDRESGEVVLIKDAMFEYLSNEVRSYRSLVVTVFYRR